MVISKTIGIKPIVLMVARQIYRIKMVLGKGFEPL